MGIKKYLKKDSDIMDDIGLACWIAKNLPIRFFGDKVLKQKCLPFKEEEFGTREIKELSDTLINTLKKLRAKTGMGRGLAANQVGVPKRMIALWLQEEPDVFVNPEIVSTQGKGSYWESCISAGIILIGEIIRPWKGKFAYRDINGGRHVINADEKQTRLFLHEIDHLEGRNCLEAFVPGTMKFVLKGKEEILNYPFKKIK